jgi:hypothetical protein
MAAVEDQVAVQDKVAYIGLKDADTHLQLYKCMLKHQEFERGLHAGR